MEEASLLPMMEGRLRTETLSVSALAVPLRERPCPAGAREERVPTCCLEPQDAAVPPGVSVALAPGDGHSSSTEHRRARACCQRGVGVGLGGGACVSTPRSQ